MSQDLEKMNSTTYTFNTSLGTPASSTTKTGRHDIAEILLKVALNTKNSNSNSNFNTSLRTFVTLFWTKKKNALDTIFNGDLP